MNGYLENKAWEEHLIKEFNIWYKALAIKMTAILKL